MTALLIVATIAAATYQIAFATRPEGSQSWTGSAVKTTATAALAGMIVSTELWLAPRTGPLRAPVRAYVLLIGVMAGLAILLPQCGARVASGAALFILSDTLLALRLFVLRGAMAKRLLAVAVWPAYWSGQFLILQGAAVFG